MIASGYSADGELGDFLQNKALGFISKPFRRKELLKRVREILDRSPGSS